MASLGCLPPIHEWVMKSRNETGSLLVPAEHAKAPGFGVLRAGASVLVRPRHDALTLLAAVAARTCKVELGTVLLLPAPRSSEAGPQLEALPRMRAEPG